MNAYELRAAVLLQMDRAGICVLPAACAGTSPLAWPWGPEQTAAYRAYCDRKGLVFSTTPSTERQSQAVIADWQYIVAREVRPLVQKHAKDAAALAVSAKTANLGGTFGDPAPGPKPAPAAPQAQTSTAQATPAAAPAAPAPKAEGAAPAQADTPAKDGNDLSSLLGKSGDADSEDS
jgi:hypothetical protein